MKEEVGAAIGLSTLHRMMLGASREGPGDEASTPNVRETETVRRVWVR